MNASSVAEQIRARMATDGAPPLVMEAFLQNVQRWNAGDVGTIPGASLAPLGRLPRLDELDEFNPAGESAIAQTVIIKLNGGLGTSMGLEQAKSLIIAKNGLSFLDIIVRQVEFLRQRCRAPLPLLLMNSFSTKPTWRLAPDPPAFPQSSGFAIVVCAAPGAKLSLATRAPVSRLAQPS